VRKLINDPVNVVREYLQGLEAAHSDVLRYDPINRVVLRSKPGRAGKVGIVAGGGSGCEPLHVGFVGAGMLDAAAPGEIYTSPVPDQIIAASRSVEAGSGVLHIIKNFSGEVMNFGMANEILEFEGAKIASVLVNDDVAVGANERTAGRRGLGATVLVEKIAGAAAERGHPLEFVRSIAERVVRNARSFGIGLSSCTPPSRGKPVYDLPDGQMDLGIGISGEPGRERMPLGTARQIGRTLVDRVVGDLAPPPGTKLLCLVNGMGGTPQQELYLLNGEINRELRDRGLKVERTLVGNFVTALDQLGAALTILALDDQMVEMWDAPVHTVAVRWGI
jgi:dihydroxyacetone kinase-like protein